MVSQSDEILLAETLEGSPGIERIEIDRALHTVSVATANQEGLTDVIWLLRHAGFPPEDEDVVVQSEQRPYLR